MAPVSENAACPIHHQTPKQIWVLVSFSRTVQENRSHFPTDSSIYSCNLFSHAISGFAGNQGDSEQLLRGYLYQYWGGGMQCPGANPHEQLFFIGSSQVSQTYWDENWLGPNKKTFMIFRWGQGNSTTASCTCKASAQPGFDPWHLLWFPRKPTRIWVQSQE